MSRKMVDAVLEMSEYNRFSKGIFGWVGFHTEWLEFEHEDRCAGTSKWPLRKLLAYSIDGITGFSVAPLSLASVMGVLFFLISMILIVFIIVRTLLFGDPVAGWPSMACILFLVSGVQLFCTGIVGIYLSKTYLETKHRPIYLLKETSEETVKMHSVQPVKKQESAAKRRKDAHTAEKKSQSMPTNAMLLKEEKSGHEKGNLKGNKRAGEITEKERSAERTAERLFGRSYRKGFYGGWSVFLFFAFVPAVRPAIRRIRLLD